MQSMQVDSMGMAMEATCDMDVSSVAASDAAATPLTEEVLRVNHEHAAELQLQNVKPTVLQVGNRMHQSVYPMRDSTSLLKAGDFSALRHRLEHDGFLLLREVISRKTALGARKMLLTHLQSKVRAIRNVSVHVVNTTFHGHLMF